MKQSKQSSAARKSPVLASLALACAMFAGNAHAGIPVVDGGHIGAQLAKFVQDFGKWAKDFAHYKSQVDHMKQELIALSNIIDTATMGLQGNPLDNIQKRPLTYGMKERCDQGSNSGFSLTNLLGGLLDIAGDNYVQKQKDICEKIVTLENSKYNDLVVALKDLQKLKGGLNKTTNDSKGANQNGEMQATTQATTQMIGELQVIAARIETSTLVYDGMIQALQSDMKNVANEALRGKKKSIVESVISDVAQTAILDTALKSQRSDCPPGFNIYQYCNK